MCSCYPFLLSWVKEINVGSGNLTRLAKQDTFSPAAVCVDSPKNPPHLKSNRQEIVRTLRMVLFLK